MASAFIRPARFSEDEWNARVEQICRCQRAECMSAATRLPPALAAPIKDYTKEDQAFLARSADQASACIAKQLADSEEKNKF